MPITNYFNITRRGSRKNESWILPTVAAPIGRAFQESATAGTAELADGSKPARFVCKAVLTDFPAVTFAEMTGQGQQPLEQEYVADGVAMGAFEDADEFVCGGPDYMHSGTGQHTAATALKSVAGFTSGKVRSPQSGEFAEFMLVEKPVIDGLQCYRYERIAGYKV